MFMHSIGILNLGAENKGTGTSEKITMAHGHMGLRAQLGPLIEDPWAHEHVSPRAPGLHIHPNPWTPGAMGSRAYRAQGPMGPRA